MESNKMGTESKDEKKTKGYYLDSVKFVRDLVHGYVYLTKFELKLVDTIEFQRLKDVRQLTCQHVYPAAKHTRFEHSLGVLELTKRAIKNLNRNGVLSAGKQELFGGNLRFNAALAALLHDVGHCPFSHLGEIEFNKDEVWERLYNNVEAKLLDTPLWKQFAKLQESTGKKPGAVHEQLSCVVILEKFYEELAKVKVEMGDEEDLSVDFELLIRSILGIEYDISAELLKENDEEYRKNQKKNVIVHLINSRVFDMDKLDYIMRDSYMTGIGTPVIDTHRLFRNMYLNEKYALVFTSRAVPALQNMIEARDGLYMYVYNHHAVVFSDFMYTYIFRRLAHNSRDFQIMIGSTDPDRDGWPITELGILPKDYLFSPDVVVEKNRSDSDLVSQLNAIYQGLKEKYRNEGDKTKVEAELTIQAEKRLEKHKKVNEALNGPLVDNIQRVYQLIERYLKRNYLKPWWKTYSEFSSFIERNFLSDKVRNRLCDWICNGPDSKPAGDEFRSQIAKHVNYITTRLDEEKTAGKIIGECGLLEALGDGNFFVIERSARFFDPETIRELDIAQKINTILSTQGEIKYSTSEYYVKELTNIIPQRNYYSLYAKNSFYIFSKPLDADKYQDAAARKRHYQLIEQIFVYVASTLIEQGAEVFQVKFGTEEARKKYEEKSKEKMYKDFAESMGYTIGEAQ